MTLTDDIKNEINNLIAYAQKTEAELEQLPVEVLNGLKNAFTLQYSNVGQLHNMFLNQVSRFNGLHSAAVAKAAASPAIDLTAPTATPSPEVTSPGFQEAPKTETGNTQEVSPVAPAPVAEPAPAETTPTA